MNSRTPSGVSREAAKLINAAVLAGRQMRHLSKQGKEANQEIEAINQTLHTIYEYGALNNMQIEFKQCMPVTTTDDDNDEQEGDSDMTHYELQVDMKKLQTGSSDVPLSGYGISQALRTQIKDALTNLKSDALELGRVKADYNFDNDNALFKVVVDLSPPPPTAVYVPVKKTTRKATKKEEAEEAEEKAAIMPSVQECVDFYGNQVSTWSLFGFDLGSVFGMSTPTHNAYTKRHTYRKHKVQRAAPY